MTNKEILLNILSGEETPRAGWVPFAGVHAGKLTGYNAIEVLTEEDKLLESLRAVNRLYNPDGQIILFDLQVEAEILGCTLRYVHDCAPSVVSHPLSKEAIVPCDCKIPAKEEGRLPMILRVMEQMKREIGDSTALIGLVCGPLTLASHLRGTDLFMDMYDDPDYVKNLLGFCTKTAKQMATFYIEAGMDIIGFVDPLISQISPDTFLQFPSEPYKELFRFVADKNVFSAFFVCGDAGQNIEPMCQTKPHAIFIDENIAIGQAKQITDRYGIALGGNIPLTTTMLYGTQDDNRQAVINIIDACGGHRGVVIAPGCDMPFDVPVENTIAVAFAVAHYEETKKMIAGYNGKLPLDDIVVTLPDYPNLTKTLVEVFTLDSLTCAACGYLMNTVNELHRDNPELFDMVEYRYTKLENIKRCQLMGIKNLPALYINGTLVYSSIIPAKHLLLEQIKNATHSD